MRQRKAHRDVIDRTLRYEFQLDMLLLQVWGYRSLPDEIAERIAGRAEREQGFVHGVHKLRHHLRLTPHDPGPLPLDLR